MNKQPLLSICIPTYNRADLLKRNLEAVLNAAKYHIDNVEIIVSDNASTDHTADIIKEFKNKYPFLRAYCNDKNIGATFNFFKLSDNYATGKYMWLLGDDDTIYRNALDVVIATIQSNPALVFIALNYSIGMVEHSKNENFVEGHEFRELSLVNAIDKQCSAGNILATFISGSIFLRDPFSQYNKVIFKPSWTNGGAYTDVFPHTHIITSVFSPLQTAAYIANPLIYITKHQKSWDKMMPKISLYYIVQVYKYYIKQGYTSKELKKSENILIREGLGTIWRGKGQFNYMFYFLRFALLRKQFYRIIINQILRNK